MAERIPPVEWAWQRQSVWSQTADNLKKGPGLQRITRLGLTVAAAALALAGSQVKSASSHASLALAILAAAALAGAALLRTKATAEQARRWTRARSVSEALKTEVYTFLSGTGKYDHASKERETSLEAEVQRIQNEAADLQRYTAGVQAEQRKLPQIQDVPSYLEKRVRISQLEKYYDPKARQLQSRLRLLKVAEVALALVAAGLAATASVAPSVAAWAAVVTTAGGAVAAFIAAERYEYLWIEYSRTASELRRLLDRGTAADGSPLSDAGLVAACEDVISVQNQTWMAKWGEETNPAADSLPQRLVPPSLMGGGVVGRRAQFA